MIFFLLIFKIFSTWWEWDSTEFEEKKRNSYKKPIFIVCYSTYCPHCSGLPEGTKQYSDSDGNRSDIFVTMIDCSKNPSCSQFQIRGTPHMVLVIGDKIKYWPRVYSKVGKDWNIFIDKYIKSNLKEILTENQLIEAKNEPSDGGTTFYLETNDKNNKFFKEIYTLSKGLIIYNDSFVYTLNKKFTTSKLTAFISPSCGIQYSSKYGSISKFINDFKFGSLHLYDWDEFLEIKSKYSTAMIIVEENLLQSQKFALKTISKFYCNNFIFGWMNIKLSKNLLKDFNISKSDLPLLIVHNKNKNCISKTKIRSFEASSSGFLKESLNGNACNFNFWEPIIKEEKIILNGITGNNFIIFYLLILFLLILLFRSKDLIYGKNE